MWVVTPAHRIPRGYESGVWVRIDVPCDEPPVVGRPVLALGITLGAVLGLWAWLIWGWM